MLWILRWFGLILLPIVSFSADGVVAICKFGIKVVQWSLPNLKIYQSSQQESPRPTPPCREQSARDTIYKDRKLHHSEFAHGRPIDLSIQFTLFWTPLLVLLGWWTERPMHLLFDYLEIALLLGACFLVNYILSDEETNMAEGFTMIAFYAMIVSVFVSLDHWRGAELA